VTVEGHHVKAVDVIVRDKSEWASGVPTHDAAALRGVEHQLTHLVEMCEEQLKASFYARRLSAGFSS
jgi:hypothetical protein